MHPYHDHAPSDSDALAEAAEPDVFAGYNGEPVLPSGSSGPDVADLCERLALAGFDTQVARGEVEPMLTVDVYRAVEEFRHAHGVVDELTSRGDHVVGPATWAALPAL